MPALPIRLDAIPIVRTTADRGTRFPDPDVNQRVHNLETGAIERWNGVTWVTDFLNIAATGTPSIQNNGTQIVALPQVLNMVGPGVVVTQDGPTAVITIPGIGAQTIQQNGTPVATGPSVINVTGGGATVTNPSDGVVQVDIPPASGIALANDGTPVSGGPFTTVNGIGGGFADLGDHEASYTPPLGSRVTSTLVFPPAPPNSCVDIGVPASGWVMETLSPSVAGDATAAWSPTLGLFCILEGGSAYLSADGTTWARSATGLPNPEFTAMVWADTLAEFVAVGFLDGTLATYTILRSADGVTWTTTTTSLGNTDGAGVYGLAWSSDLGVLVAVGVNTHTSTPLLLSSSNGTSWANNSVASGNADWDTAEAFAVCWSSDVGTFVMVGTASTTFTHGLTATSTDGVTWSPATGPNAGDVTSWQGVDYSPDQGIFAMIGGNGGGTTGPLVATSADGVTWTTQTTPSDAFGNSASGGMTWSPFLQLFLAGGGFGSGSAYNLMVSPDGTNWTATTDRGLFVQIVESSTLGVLIGVGLRATSGDGNYARNSPAQEPCHIYTKEAIADDVFGRIHGEGDVPAFRVVTADDALGAADEILLVDATAGDVTIHAPNAGSGPAIGQRYTVKKIDSGANTVTIDSPDSFLFDGASTIVLSDQWASVTFVAGVYDSGGDVNYFLVGAYP